MPNCVAEARTHGVGYYGFSKDGEERLKQQEALKQLREETIQKQKRAQELKEMREKQLAARMKAAKDRRRARLGLPPEEEGLLERSYIKIIVLSFFQNLFLVLNLLSLKKKSRENWSMKDRRKRKKNF